jgi:hypothetical protein
MPQKTLGKIVRSDSQVDYICQIYNRGDVNAPLTPDDYAFGTFVKVTDSFTPSRRLIGVIRNTMLLNPEFGRLGPRLSPAPTLTVFAPDYLEERMTLVSIFMIGIHQPAGDPVHGVAVSCAPLDSLVERMSEDEIRDFHRSGSGVLIAYIPLLLANPEPLSFHLIINILDQLTRLFPMHTDQFAVLRTHLAWKSVIQTSS